MKIFKMFEKFRLSCWSSRLTPNTSTLTLRKNLILSAIDQRLKCFDIKLNHGHVQKGNDLKTNKKGDCNHNCKVCQKKETLSKGKTKLSKRLNKLSKKANIPSVILITTLILRRLFYDLSPGWCRSIRGFGV